MADDKPSEEIDVTKVWHATQGQASAAKRIVRTDTGAKPV